MQTQAIESPLGILTLVATDLHLAAVLWPSEDPMRIRWAQDSDAPQDIDVHHASANPMAVADSNDAPGQTHVGKAVIEAAALQLQQYFSGRRQIFDLPLQFRGTAFQTTVWRALQTIPYGQTRSYGALAASIDRPTASRAVGAANGRNPLSIVVPCHRVIGAAGTLTGFAGGLKAKQYLLALEQRHRS